MLIAGAFILVGLLSAMVFFLLKARIDRLLNGEEWKEKVQSEVDSMVLEINQTAEWGVSLLENRIQTMQKLLEEANHKILLLTREKEKSDLSHQVYSHLKNQVPSPPEKAEEDSFREKVMKLYEEGYTSQVISQKLQASVSEVDLIINLGTGWRGKG